jgi:N6-L-threonylcarbamoyladenine synthase
VRVLGIESSCDETSASLVDDGRRILSTAIASQVDLHRRYGGIVPEVASRQHILQTIPVLRQVLEETGTGLAMVDAVAVTKGPGLAGSLLVGVNVAKSMSFALGKPLVGVNHIEAHIYANWLVPEADPPEFPLVCLVVSGGHTELILMKDHLRYRLLGMTCDDAAGEAFDKVSRILGLGYPGGPAIELAASTAAGSAGSLPRAWLRGTYDFSFSGLKTAMLHKIDQYQYGQQKSHAGKARTAYSDWRGKSLPETVPVNDLAAAFQEAVVDVLTAKTAQAAQHYGAKSVVLAGGVASNSLLRRMIIERSPVPVTLPPVCLCTDNAAMVGAAGYYRLKAGEMDGLDMDVEPSLGLV